MTPGPTMPMTDPIVDDLNPVQREAVLYGDGPLLILAGAGSGKTRVLTRRMAHLILRRSVPPDRILAVTFTNKAADEMRHRVEQMLGYEARGLWIGTFHSVCLRLLRRHADRLGFASSITVYDQDDSLALLREILRETGGDAESPRVKELQGAISSAKNQLWDPDDLANKSEHPDRARVARVYREYQLRLRAQSGVDFDDILVLSARLVERDQEIGDLYAERFLHVLVDEYQDTNHVQYRFVRRIARRHENITVVGDDDQSIYGWRGADISNILEFERSFPRASVLRMTQNYRSTQAILDVANAVVKRNRSRLEKSLWTENAGGAAVRLLVSLDEEREAQTVVREVLAAVRSGLLAPNAVTILYRIHAQSRPFEEACLTLGLPYVIIGGIAFYQRKEVKDLLAYLRLAVNPRDRVSFRRAVASPKRGLGDVGVGRIEQVAQERYEGDLARACAELTPIDGIKGRALAKAREFGDLVIELAGRVAEGPEPLLHRVLEATEYVEWLREQEPSTWEERRANVAELEEGAGRYQTAAADPGLSAYLDQVALYTSLDRGGSAGDRITLMTVHNAKGLEFKVVYITGLEEGLFPHASSMGDAAELEEERRLFYVAATRAMQQLTLSASLERRRANRYFEGGLSRFIGEIPDGALVVESNHGTTVAELIALSERWGAVSPRYGQGNGGRRSGLLALENTSDYGDDMPIADAPDAGYQARRPQPGGTSQARPRSGDSEQVVQRESAPKATMVGRRVRHAVFGIGKVEEQDGTGPESRLSIHFPGVGRKKILARFVQRVEP